MKAAYNWLVEAAVAALLLAAMWMLEETENTPRLPSVVLAGIGLLLGAGCVAWGLLS